MIKVIQRIKNNEKISHILISFFLKGIGEGLFTLALFLIPSFVTKEENGQVQALINFLMLWSPVCIVGLGNFAIRTLSKEKTEKAKLDIYIYGGLLMLITTTIVFFVISTFSTLDHSKGILFFSLLMWSFMLFDRDYLRGRFKPFLSDLGFQVLKGAGVLIIVLVFFYNDFFDFEIFSISVSALLFFIFLVNKISIFFKKAQNLSINTEKYKDYFLDTMKLTGSSVIRIVFERIDIFLVGIFIGIVEAGIYAVLQRLSNLPALFLDPTRNALRPFFAKAFIEKDAKGLNRMFLRGNLLLSILSIFTCFGIYLFSDIIFSYINEDYINYSSVLYILLLGRTINGCLGLSASMINMMYDEMFHAAVLLIVMILFVSLCWIFSNRGLSSVAWSFSICLILINVILFIRSKYLIKQM